MKRLTVVFVAIAAAALAGCSDGVPAVTDYSKIVVNGKPMTHAEFLDTYCTNAPTNETCVRVGKAMREKATKGDQVKGW